MYVQRFSPFCVWLQILHCCVGVVVSSLTSHTGDEGSSPGSGHIGSLDKRLDSCLK